jgi:uncharacterized protein (DUF433 family)
VYLYLQIGDNGKKGSTLSTSTRISVTPGVLGGKPCIAGHRVRVSDIVIWHEHQGLTADAIVAQIPGLTLADVHAALSYYYENLDAVREEMRAELAVAQSYQGNGESILRAKLSQSN